LAEPRLIEGALAIDDRGSLSFVNDFAFDGVRRFYVISNHRAGFVRAWHGHRREAKYVAAVVGAAIVAAVKVDDWARPSKDLPVHRYVLSTERPAVLHIPPGFANGFMSLTSETRLLIFSSASLEESLQDDVRYDAYYWNPWQVVER
jgi:dTDP-4-dehydrorhamnose 3,5-epimerase-like enzyme